MTLTSTAFLLQSYRVRHMLISFLCLSTIIAFSIESGRRGQTAFSVYSEKHRQAAVYAFKGNKIHSFSCRSLSEMSTTLIPFSIYYCYCYEFVLFHAINTYILFDILLFSCHTSFLPLLLFEGFLCNLLFKLFYSTFHR